MPVKNVKNYCVLRKKNGLLIYLAGNIDFRCAIDD
jgi:hypothetical protein